MSNWNLVIPMEGKNFLTDIDLSGASGVAGSSITSYNRGSEPIVFKYRGNANQVSKNSLGNSHDAIAKFTSATSVEYPITCRDFKYLGVSSNEDAYGTQQGIFCYSVWIYLPSSNNTANYEDAGDLFWAIQGVNLAGDGVDSGEQCIITQQTIDFSLHDQWQQIYVIGYTDIPTVPFPDAEITISLESSSYSGASWEYYLCGAQLELLNEPYDLYGYLRPTTLIHNTILGCETIGRYEFEDYGNEWKVLGYRRNDKWGGLIYNFEDDLSLPIEAYQGTGLSKRDIETYTSLKAGKNANVDESSWTERTLMFRSKLIGSGTQDLSNKRRLLQSLFSNLGTQILYTGDGIDKIIKVEYASGLEGTSPTGYVEENITINFNAYEPYFYALQKESFGYISYSNGGGFEIYSNARVNDDMITRFTKYGEFVYDNGVKTSVTLDDSNRVNDIAIENDIVYFVGDTSGTPSEIGLGYIANGIFTFNTDVFTGNTKLVAVDRGFVAVVGKLNPVDTSYSVGFWCNDGGMNVWGTSDIGDSAHPMGLTTDLPTKMTVYRQGDVFWICLYLPNETTRFRNVVVVKATLDRTLSSWTSEFFTLSDLASNAGTLTNGWSATRYVHDAILIPNRDSKIDKPLVVIGGQFTYTTYSPNLTWQNNVVLEPDELGDLTSGAHEYQYLYDGWYNEQDVVFYRIAQIVWSKMNKALYYAEYNNNDTTFGVNRYKTRITSKEFGVDSEIIKDNLVYNSASSTTKPITNMIVDHKGRPICYGRFAFEYNEWFVNQQPYQTKYRTVLTGGNITFDYINQVLVDGRWIIHQFPNIDLNRITYDAKSGDLIYAPDGANDIISDNINTRIWDADAYKLEFDAFRCELHYIHDIMNDRYFIINETIDSTDDWHYRQENGVVEIQSSEYGNIYFNCEDIILYPKQLNTIRLNIVQYSGVYPYGGSDKPYGILTPMFIKIYAGVGY